MQSAAELEQELVEFIAQFDKDPLGFVEACFPWGEPGDLKEHSGPRDWQREEFAAVGAHLQNPETRFEPFQDSVASGHGIGKSAWIGQLIVWALSTCADTKVVITANTKTQLKTKTQPEVAKWFRLAINAHWFEVQVESIKSKEKEHEQTWRADFVTWTITNTDAFAGLHNQGKRIVIIYDEAAGIADKVWEVTLGALTDEFTEILWIAFGNPSRNTGSFHACFHKFSHRWRHRHIDARTVPGTNKKYLQSIIDDFGEDSDPARIRVRGEFPRASWNQFIAQDVVAACRKFKAEGYEGQQKILSIDVARFGDDMTVVGLRQGRKFQIIDKWGQCDTVQSALRIIPLIDEHKPDAVVVDGDGLGAGVIDTLRHHKYEVFEFHGSYAASDSKKYFNKRCECWGLMRDALKAGMEIPDSPEMEEDLVGPEYGYNNQDQIQLERKEDMKARGLRSPDRGDCLAMSYSVRLAPKKPKVTVHKTYSPGTRSQSWMS